MEDPRVGSAQSDLVASGLERFSVEIALLKPSVLRKLALVTSPKDKR